MWTLCFCFDTNKTRLKWSNVKSIIDF
jgi:hypothetical protein